MRLRNTEPKIYGVATHPILSGRMQKIENSGLKKLVVANTVPLNIKSKKIEILDISRLFAHAILRNNENQSISALFKVE
jgi:ribose-phosphate pyrophosphokinase